MADKDQLIKALRRLHDAAETINHLIGEDESRCEAWVHEADALEDAIQQAVKVLDDKTRHIYVNPTTLEMYEHYLDTGQGFQDERPDGTVDVWTADFGEGIVMDVKLVNAASADGGCWTEAVLFKNGCEIANSDVCAHLRGPWILEDGNERYIILIHSK